MEDNLDQKKIDEFIKKVNDSKDNQLDLSSDEDLSIAIMNLISIEEHFFFTANKTGKPEYFDMLSTAREMRKELLKRIVKDPEGEVWCISKHLLAASMRLMEVGTKALSRNNKKDAEDLFKKSYQLYSLFWGLNLKLIDMGEVKKLEDNQINKQDTTPSSAKASAGQEKGIMSKLGKVVQSVIDCCKE
jgi:hypothetical protein